MASPPITNSSDVQVQPLTDSKEFDQALSEFHLMLRYALRPKPTDHEYIVA